jgi:hypothetical protein
MAAGMAGKYSAEIAAAKEKQRQIANMSKAKHALDLALRTRRYNNRCIATIRYAAYDSKSTNYLYEHGAAQALPSLTTRSDA